MRIVFTILIILWALQLCKAQQSNVVIGVFRDKHFEGKEVPAGLRPEHFMEAWRSLPNVKMVYLDIDEIRSYSAIFKNQMDILIFPYGGYYPMEAYGYYSGQSFNYFLKKGGAVISTGEVPFSKQTDKRLSTPGKSDSLNIDRDVYDKWLSKFGIKYYVSATIPSKTAVNYDFLPNVPATMQLVPGRIGIVSNNSSHEPVPKPSNGNVFPERYPARQVIPLLTGCDQFNKVLATNALLVQDFENGSRQILIANAKEPHLLSPSPQLPGIMADIFRLITNKVFAKDIECAYACYKPGEEVLIKAELVSFEMNEEVVEVRLDILDSSKKIVHTITEQSTILPKQTITKNWSWKPKIFAADEYTVRLRIYRKGKVVSEAENGFVVWNDEVVKNGPGISKNNEYFTIGKDETFMSGTNYYESTRGEIMWFRPNVKNMSKDIKDMQSAGVNYIRPHYHHLKWFKDYLLYHHNQLFEFYKSLDTVNNPLPDERGWRIWDMFIYLTQKYKIVYGGDLFTLVPEEMGDPRGWWGTTETIYTKTGRAVQKEFLKQVDKRYADVKGISWDLFNEPFDIPHADIEAWAADLKQTLTENNTGRLISIGGSDHISKDIVDYETPHGIPPANDYNTSGIPTVMQELHIDRKEGFDDEKDQAEALRQQYFVVIKNGYAGICPWSWSRQMRLWQDSYEHHYSFAMEKWDDRLGLHTHDDGTIKMAGQVFSNMSFLVKKIAFTDFDSQTNKVTTSKGEVVVNLIDSAYSLYHVNNKNFFAAVSKNEISWQGTTFLKGTKGAYLYLYSNDDKPINTSKQLLLKSEKPGTLYLNTFSKKPNKIYLVKPADGKNVILKELKATVRNGELVIDLEEDFASYWIEVNFK